MKGKVEEEEAKANEKLAICNKPFLACSPVCFKLRASCQR